MKTMIERHAVGGFLALALAAFGISAAGAETLVENSAEHRLQIDFHVSDSALKAFLPAGWASNDAAFGPAKDANLRMIFVDQIDITGPDGKPLGKGSNRFAYLAAPVKQTGTNNVGQMIISGLSADSAGAPGSFGVFLAADDAEMHFSLDARNGPLMGQEDWKFAAASGAHMEAHITYERAGGTHSSSPSNFYSAADPTNYEIWKVDQSLDIMRNVTVDVGTRVKDFSYTAGGGAIASLFDGTEKVLSLDSQPAYNRVASKP